MTPSRRAAVLDLAIAAALLALVVTAYTAVNPSGVEPRTGPGGLTFRSLPYIYAGLLLLLTLIYAAGALRTLLRPDAEPPETADAASPAAALVWWRRVATLTVLLVYAAALQPFGFALTTPLFLWVMLYCFGQTRHLKNLLLALLGGALLWLLFVQFLKLPLRGRLWDPLTPWLGQTLRALGLN